MQTNFGFEELEILLQLRKLRKSRGWGSLTVVIQAGAIKRIEKTEIIKCDERKMIREGGKK